MRRRKAGALSRAHSRARSLRCLGKEDLHLRLGLMREQELEDKEEEAMVEKSEEFGRSVKRAQDRGCKAAERRAMFQRYMERKIDHFYVIYVLQSGRNVDAWLAALRVLAMAERERVPSSKEGELRGSSAIEGKKGLFAADSVMRKRGIRDAQIEYDRAEQLYNERVEKRMGVGFEKGFWEEVLGDLGDLRKYFSRKKPPFLNGEEPAFRVAIEEIERIESKMDEVEKEERARELALGLGGKGADDRSVEGVRSGSRPRVDFAEGNWDEVKAIMLREEQVEGLGKEIDYFCLSLIRKFEAGISGWMRSPRRLFNRSFEDVDCVPLSSAHRAAIGRRIQRNDILEGRISSSEVILPGARRTTRLKGVSVGDKRRRTSKEKEEKHFSFDFEDFVARLRG